MMCKQAEAQLYLHKALNFKFKAPFWTGAQDVFSMFLHMCMIALKIASYMPLEEPGVHEHTVRQTRFELDA